MPKQIEHTPRAVITVPLQHIFNPHDSKVAGVIRHPGGDDSDIFFTAKVKIVGPSLTAGFETVEVDEVTLLWQGTYDEFVLWSNEDYYESVEAKVLLPAHHHEFLVRLVTEQVNDTITAALGAAHRAFREEQTA